MKQLEVLVRTWRNTLPLPLQSCYSWMLVKENPDRKIIFERVCVCVCVCVCVYILPPWRLLPSARCLRLTWGVRINDLVLWILIWVLLPSSFVSVSKSVIFHLQRETPALRKLERKQNDIFEHAKRWYKLI